MRYPLITSTTYRGYELQAPAAPFIKPMLDKSISVIEHYNQLYSESLVVRFDLRFSSKADLLAHECSKRVSQLMTNAKAAAKKQGISFGYFWVLEQNSDDARYHAHCLLIYPRRQVQLFKTDVGQGKVIADLWNDLNPEAEGKGNKLVNVGNKDYIPNPTGAHVISRDNPSSLLPVIYHISYMSKLKSKAMTDDSGYMLGGGLRRYGSSQLPSVYH